MHEMWHELWERRAARGRDERGAVLILGALFAVVAIVASALAVDIGRVAQAKRDDHRVADLAALDAARAFFEDPPVTTAVLQSLAEQSARRNGFDPSAPGNSVVATPGILDTTTCTFAPSSDTAVNAVRVTIGQRVPFFFAAGSLSPQVDAIASLTTLAGRCPNRNPFGTVRIGSTLASADFDSPGGGGSVSGTVYAKILNRTVSRSISKSTSVDGGAFSLDAVSWKGVANASVTFSQLQTALGMSAVSPSGVLAANLTYKQLLDATIAALNSTGSSSDAQVATKLGTISAAVDNTVTSAVQLGKLMGIAGNVGNGSDVADVALRVLDIVEGGAMVANGQHFLSFDLAASELPAIPGLGTATVRAGLIEAPQQTSGAPGKDANGAYLTQAHTAQIRVEIDATLTVPIGLLGNVTVSLPFYVEGATGTASLDSLACSGNQTPDGVSILGQTDALSSTIGTVSDADLADGAHVPAKHAATLVNIAGVVTVSMSSWVTTTVPGASKMLTFTPAYSETSPSQPVPAGTLNLPTIASGDLQITAGAGLIVPVATVASAVTSGVDTATPGIGSYILGPVLKAVGVGFAGADVWAPPVQNCDSTSFQGTPSTLSVPVLVG